MLLSLHFIALKKIKEIKALPWVRAICHLTGRPVRVCPVNVVCYVNEFKGDRREWRKAKGLFRIHTSIQEYSCFSVVVFFPIYCTAISFILMSHTVPPVSHVLLLLFWHRSHILSKTITIFYAMYSFTCIGFPFYLPT